MEKKNSSKIKVFFVDDHPIVCSGLRSELTKSKGIVCVGEATNGKEAVEMLAKISCDVILLDMDMPELDGLKTSNEIFKLKPDAKIIGMHDNDNYLLEFMCTGAMGYLLKDSQPEELIKAIKSAHNGTPYLSLKIDKSLLKRHNELLRRSRAKNGNGKELTKRESEVLTLLANGFTNKEIAFKLKLSVRTVESHRVNIMKKLNIKTVSGLTKYAISKGMIKAE